MYNRSIDDVEVEGEEQQIENDRLLNSEINEVVVIDEDE